MFRGSATTELYEDCIKSGLCKEHLKELEDFEVIPSKLSLVEEYDKYTHLINLDDAVDAQDILNILTDSTDESGIESGEDKEKAENANCSDQKILDETETYLDPVEREIFLTILSNFIDRCAHELHKEELEPRQIGRTSRAFEAEEEHPKNTVPLVPDVAVLWQGKENSL